MIDLYKSGLPLKMDGVNLVFGDGLDKVGPDARALDWMKKVVMDSSLNEPKEFYYMYRAISKDEDREKFGEYEIRYDITIIPPLRLGKEFNKTFGHYHPKPEGSDYSYPEVYEVLHGKAHYLLQNEKDVVLVEASAGDKAVMFPNYGHITINPGKDVLVMANLVCSEFRSLYGDIGEKHGGMYYETLDGWVKNKNYGAVPEMRKMTAKKVPEFGITEKSLYESFVKTPELFDWLRHPAKYMDAFVDLMK
ncbi:MAG: glucose-6-phosphate isomerase family protein [Candidatus Diapherotrites archaeon]